MAAVAASGGAAPGRRDSSEQGRDPANGPIPRTPRAPASPLRRGRRPRSSPRAGAASPSVGHRATPDGPAVSTRCRGARVVVAGPGSAPAASACRGGAGGVGMERVRAAVRGSALVRQRAWQDRVSRCGSGGPPSTASLSSSRRRRPRRPRHLRRGLRRSPRRPRHPPLPRRRRRGRPWLPVSPRPCSTRTRWPLFSSVFGCLGRTLSGRSQARLPGTVNLWKTPWPGSVDDPAAKYGPNG